MARKAQKKSVATATLPSGSKVTASQEVIDKVTKAAPQKSATAKKSN